jgi:hypothetical protein
MDAAIFFLPLVLVVAQYFTAFQGQQRELRRDGRRFDDPCHN